jgi:hypothetical protein
MNQDSLFPLNPMPMRISSMNQLKFRAYLDHAAAHDQASGSVLII